MYLFDHNITLHNNSNIYRKSGDKSLRRSKQWPLAKLVTTKPIKESSEQRHSTKSMPKVKPLISPNFVDNLFKQTRFTKYVVNKLKILFL